MKFLAMIAVVLTGGLLIFHTGAFPDFGDANSPANTYLSPYYLENGQADTHAPNVVTSVLADYRGYDTMFETTVVFAAGLACFFLLRRKQKPGDTPRMYRHLPTGVTLHIKEGGTLPAEDSAVFRRLDSEFVPHQIIIKNTCRIVIPFIQIFALYVVAHGHYSPGGGFQGGVLLAASFILYAISHDLRRAIRRFPEKVAALFGSMGVLIYAGTGVLCLLFGANFLNYEALAPLLGVSPVMARSHGILIVEIGVAFAVMAVIIWIYYNLSSAGKHDEGL
ncbi:Na(+)/H(+) antiporter subunit B [Desulfoluna sp.]|uniref:Na(+)/H(+) antiporter subunit B n=1 Tax=Desulfoluna sp. TaxID=2045199 RepID=UPI002606B10F|nr:Na(+)/H(+) antiporter subunit B [Desulfoluna sp.]